MQKRSVTVILAALLTVSLIGAQKIRQNSRRQGESALEAAGRRQGALEAADLKSITKLNTEVKKQVALTFDDGPGPYTDKLLEGLREREVRATFFLIGENLAGREETVRRMVQDGHLIGSHTDTHVELTKLPLPEALSEIRRTNEKIEAVTGVRWNISVRPTAPGIRNWSRRSV